jgi:hypothetical protein
VRGNFKMLQKVLRKEITRLSSGASVSIRAAAFSTKAADEPVLAQSYGGLKDQVS